MEYQCITFRLRDAEKAAALSRENTVAPASEIRLRLVGWESGQELNLAPAWHESDHYRDIVTAAESRLGAHPKREYATFPAGRFWSCDAFGTHSFRDS
jgi:hypothetical protein